MVEVNKLHKTYLNLLLHTFGRIIDFLQTLEKNGKGGQKNKRQNVNHNGGYFQEEITNGLVKLKPVASTALKILDAPIKRLHIGDLKKLIQQAGV